MLVFNVTATPTRHRQQHAGVQRHCNTHTSPTAACWCSTSLQHPYLTDSSMLVFNVTATPTRHRQQHAGVRHCNTHTSPTAECWCSTSLQHPHVTDRERHLGLMQKPLPCRRSIQNATTTTTTSTQLRLRCSCITNEIIG